MINILPFEIREVNLKWYFLTVKIDDNFLLLECENFMWKLWKSYENIKFDLDTSVTFIVMYYIMSPK